MPLFVLFSLSKCQDLRHKEKGILPTMKLKAILLLLAMLLLVIAACDSASGTNGQTGTTGQIPEQKSLTLEVTNADGNVTSHTVQTTEETVGAALLKEGLIDGDESEFGLMVLFVNGIRADFVEDNAWWAFYIDDEMAMAGVDSTDIDEGVTYKFVYTPA